MDRLGTVSQRHEQPGRRRPIGRPTAPRVPAQNQREPAEVHCCIQSARGIKMLSWRKATSLEFFHHKDSLAPPSSSLTA